MEPPKPHPFFKKFTRGDAINSQAKQVILNVFFQLASLNPEKTWVKVANEAAALTGVYPTTIFKLKSEKQKSMLQESQNSDNVAAGNMAGGANHPSGDEGNVDGATVAPPPPVKKKKVARPPSPRSKPRTWKQRPNIHRKKRIERYDEAILTAIRLKMHQYTARNEAPTLVQFLTDVNADTNLPNFSRSTLRLILIDMGLFRFCKRRRVRNPQVPDQSQSQNQSVNQGQNQGHGGHCHQIHNQGQLQGHMHGPH